MTARTYGELVESKNLLGKLLQKWNEKLHTSLTNQEFLQCFEQLYVLVPDTKMRNFQFRYLHRVIFCAKILKLWGIVDSPICFYCGREYETLEHLFFLCPVVGRFWETFVSWYEASTNTEITLTLEEVSLANHDIKLISTLIIMAKQHIFARRVIERVPNIYIFRDMVKNTMKIERENAIANRRCKSFLKKWKLLIE